MQEFLGKPLNLCTCFEAQTINDQFTDPRLLRRALSARIYCTGSRDCGFLVHVRLSIENVF